MFREYYKLYGKTFCKLWKNDIDWRGYSVELLTAVIGGWLFVRTNEWAATTTIPFDFILYSFAVPITLALIYTAYKLVIAPVEIYKELRDEAFKYTWRDVDITIEPFEPDYVVAYGIRIKHTKTAAINDVVIKLVLYEIDKELRSSQILPAPLAWLNDREYRWKKVNIEGGSKGIVAALFTLHEYKGGIALVIPGPDGQPKDKKAMADLSPNERIMFADLLIMCSVDKHEMYKELRVRAEIVDGIPRVEFVPIPPKL